MNLAATIYNNILSLNINIAFLAWFISLILYLITVAIRDHINLSSEDKIIYFGYCECLANPKKEHNGARQNVEIANSCRKHRAYNKACRINRFLAAVKNIAISDSSIKYGTLTFGMYFAVTINLFQKKAINLTMFVLGLIFGFVITILVPIILLMLAKNAEIIYFKGNDGKYKKLLNVSEMRKFKKDTGKNGIKARISSNMLKSQSGSRLQYFARLMPIMGIIMLILYLGISSDIVRPGLKAKNVGTKIMKVMKRDEYHRTP
jgi:hypothetical protein